MGREPELSTGTSGDGPAGETVPGLVEGATVASVTAAALSPATGTELARSSTDALLMAD
ncbi:hypothetical protein [Pseudarthrobacter sp. PS3-L1]|uniref:hypothetical protein n=1 Tax=Pseudarthrobacter sp. PS3-L1 TaxID=3046207 RepID=UPI0024BBD431|nr:hypothetical protein [Pseudarthrobacter sp. PS3-L1]